MPRCVHRAFSGADALAGKPDSRARCPGGGATRSGSSADADQG
jgi:hypothetical protein